MRRRSRTTYRPTVTPEGSTHVDMFTGITSSFCCTDFESLPPASAITYVLRSPPCAALPTAERRHGFGSHDYRVCMGELRAFKRPDPLWREAVGETLRRRRSDAGLRLVDVAKRAGVSPQYLSEVERGCKDPSSEVLAAVAGALDLTVLQLATMTVAAASTPATARGGAEAMCLTA